MFHVGINWEVAQYTHTQCMQAIPDCMMKVWVSISQHVGRVMISLHSPRIKLS